MSAALAGHAGGVVRTARPPGARFGVVSRELLEDVRLPLGARLVAAWLESQQEGWQISAPHLCRRLGLSKDRWQRIVRQLQEAGYMTRARGRAAGGTWVWTSTFDSEAGLTIARAGSGSTGAGKSSDGQTGDGLTGSKRRQVEEDKSNKTSLTRARAPAPQKNEQHDQKLIEQAQAARREEIKERMAEHQQRDDLALKESLNKFMARRARD